MLKYALDSVSENRRQDRGDRAGLIIFGREASIEFPPIDDELPNIARPESYLGKTDATNLESALKLAQATFPEDSARRIVLLTDGNETLGTSEAIAKNLTDAGIGIDVVPIRLESSAEILVEKIDIPGNVRQGQPFDAKVVIQRYVEDGSNRPVDGKLLVKRRAGNQEELISNFDMTLDRDVNVIPIPGMVESPNGYTYTAEFIPAIRSDGISNDAISQNNRATAFTYARGKGRVLLIEDASNRGDFELMVDALRRNDIEVDVQPSNRIFTSLIELQAYDSVILAGVPQTSGEQSTEISSFSDEQIEMLVTNTQQFGSGILMIGGPEAFGAGGWANTKLEEAMPVDFQIKNEKVEAVGALAMVMHASEIAQGNFWQVKIGRAALDVLGPMDYCGIVQFDMLGDRWMWGGKNGMLKVGPSKALMRARLSTMTPGDMPDFDPAMQMALQSLKNTPAAVKHMIVISDGDPSATSQAVLNGFATAQIKVSTVAVGAHGPAGHSELQRIATATGGNYYVVTSPQALPKIFVREARRVAKPLIFEPEGGVQPQIVFRHELLEGIAGPLPPIKGFVLTDRKKSSLVEVPILSPAPTEQDNASILATWSYGLGRTAVLSTDAGNRWAADWTDWPDYDKFFSQLVRWTMRPSLDEGKYQIATRVVDGRVQVIVNALDPDDRFLNFLDMSGVGVTPDMQPFPITMRQQAPGRYVGEFEVDVSGSFMVSVMPSPGEAPLTTGVTIPFSDEYRLRQVNSSLLGKMAGLQPIGGQQGQFTEPLEPENLNELTNSLDTYRAGLPMSRSLQDVWPQAILFGALLFFVDVLIRRVALDPAAAITQLRKRFAKDDSQNQSAQAARFDRLRSEKSAVNEELDKRRSATQFTPTASSETQASSHAASEFDSSKPSQPKSSQTPDQPQSMAADTEQESYTSRLLKAKRDAKRKTD
jgi:uncharacterized membrane protein